VTTDGPHVVFGRGDICVDRIVTSLITQDRLPARDVTTCPGELVGPYVPNPPAQESGYVDAYAAAYAIVEAILYNPTYQNWPGVGHLQIGCDAGGAARYRVDPDDDVHVILDDCAWTPGVPVDGRISIADWGQGAVGASLDLPFADLSVDAEWNVTGTFRGQPVD
jgi:hypothetical protein